MFKILLSQFIKQNGRNPNNLEMILLRQKAANQAVDERKVVNMFDREPVNPNKPILGGKNIDETEEQIRQRLIKQNEQGIANLKNKLDDPEQKAMGGRIGYAGGSKVVQGLLKALQDKFGKKAITTADKLKPPQKTLDRDMFKKFKDRNPDPNREMTEDEIYDFADEIGGELDAYDFDGTVGSANRIRIEHKEYMDDMYQQYRMGKLDPEPGDKSEARKIFLQNKLDEMEATGDKKLMTVDEIEELSNFDLQAEMDVAKSLAPKMVERLELKQKYPGITDDLLDKILIDGNMQRKAEVLATIDEAFKMMEKGKGVDEILDTMKNVTRTKQADGGIMRARIGLKGGLTPSDYLKVKDMLNHYHDYRKGGGTMSKKNFAISFFRENNAEGGRAGFAGGGMGRRGFLKLLGGVGAGIAGLKSGLVNLMGKGGTKEVVKEVAQSAGSGTPPPYFFKLVEKIKKFGDDVTPKYSTQERQVVKQYKDYELTEDMGTGKIEISKKNFPEGDEAVDYFGEPLMEDVYMSYKPGEMVEGAGGKVLKSADEYIEDTAYVRSRGPQTGDISSEMDGIAEETFKKIIKDIDEAPSIKIKKASGGIARMLGE